MKGAAILLGTFLGGGLIRAVIGLFKPLASLVFSIVRTGALMLWMVGKPIAKLAFGLATTVAKVAIPAAVAAFKLLKRVMLANPFIAIGAAVVGAAYLIYRNWDDIVEFFERNVAADQARVLLGWWEGINDYWAGFWANTVAAVGIDEWLFKLVGYKDRFFAAVTGWWSGIIEWVRAKWQAITDLIPDFLKREIGIDVAGPASVAARRRPSRRRGAYPPARSAAEAARWTAALSSTSATRRPARESPASKTAPTKSRWTLTPGS